MYHCHYCHHCHYGAYFPFLYFLSPPDPVCSAPAAADDWRDTDQGVMCYWDELTQHQSLYKRGNSGGGIERLREIENLGRFFNLLRWLWCGALSWERAYKTITIFGRIIVSIHECTRRCTASQLLASPAGAGAPAALYKSQSSSSSFSLLSFSFLSQLLFLFFSLSLFSSLALITLWK